MNKLIDELSEGEQMGGETLESVFEISEGKQQMCEMLYLLGLMLIFASKFTGIVRERYPKIISHFAFIEINFQSSK